MLNDLPRRSPVPFLPVPAVLLLDDRRWAYQSEHGGPGGTARVRVWRGIGNGHLAVVTETGDGLSVTKAAREIWKRLLDEFGPPLALAELWPDGTGVDEHLHLDLVQVPGPSARVGWQRVYPSLPGHPLHDLVSTWWDLSGDDILAP